MIFASDVVDWSALGQAVWVSAAAGIGVLLLGAVAVAASLRAADARRDGGGGTVAAYRTTTLVCIIVLVAAVAEGIHVMTQK